MWQHDQQPPSKVRRTTSATSTPNNTASAAAAPSSQQRANVPTCPYCNSRFASGNNLRRHIVEVHKRNDAKTLREASGSPAVFVDKPKECVACSMTFKTLAEWIDHKIQHARTVKPSSTFEWGCECCGKMFTRKERLLQHMITHLNDNFDDVNGLVRNQDENSNSQLENSMCSESSVGDGVGKRMKKEEQIDEKDSLKVDFECQLCHATFDSGNKLKQHITDHFMNGDASNKSESHASAASSSDESEPNEKMAAFAEISQDYKCRICGTVCQDQLEMMTCMSSHQTQTSLKCSECQLYFSSDKQVINHQTLYHAKNYI